MSTKKETPQPITTISNCQFTGVQFDAKAVEAITLIAKAFQANAEGLTRLVSVLTASNVTIETMIKLPPPSPQNKL